MSRVRTSISAATSRPAYDGRRLAMSKTLACLRWTTPNPSLTKTSQSAAYSSASSARSASSLLVSRASNRTFSSTQHAAGASDADGRHGLRAGRRRDERDGSVEQLAEPRRDRCERQLSARPRPWGARGGRRRRPAPRRRRAAARVGTLARMRPSSVMLPVVHRHVEVGADEDAGTRAARPAPAQQGVQGTHGSTRGSGRRSRRGRRDGWSSPTRCRTSRPP